MKTNEELVDYLVGMGALRDLNIIRAISRIDRKDFVGERNIPYAYDDSALSIGYGQTISQPMTVAFMLEQLAAKEGDRVLEIGYGSGWATAILAEILGPKGKVFALEIIPQLCRMGEENVSKYKLSNIEFIKANGSIGLKSEAPFDRILCSAAALVVPPGLREQLKIGGKLVIPVGNVHQEIRVIERMGDRAYKKQRFPGFVFVALRGKYGVSNS
jgi:protein-L-isoaspartate(D-aspartate) O-methyltransferase